MYPDSPGYQRSSETSKAAAESSSIYGYRRAAFDFLRDAGERGATAKELAEHLSLVFGKPIQFTTAGARLTELKKRGLAVEAGEQRDRSDVIILKEWL